MLPIETCPAQVCGFQIDHTAGSFSIIFALVINIPFVRERDHALGDGGRFQNPLEAISSFITISHPLPLALSIHSLRALTPQFDLRGLCCCFAEPGPKAWMENVTNQIMPNHCRVLKQTKGKGKRLITTLETGNVKPL